MARAVSNKFIPYVHHKRHGLIVKIIKTKNGHWEIYRPQATGDSVGIIVLYKDIMYNNYEFNTRLISRNGKLICGNSGFNTMKSALTNITAVKYCA